MLTKEEAILSAKVKVKGLNYIDPEQVVKVFLATREAALAAGVKDDPMIRNRWQVLFKRIPTGHPLDGLFEWLAVSVDAETGEATIIESL